MKCRSVACIWSGSLPVQKVTATAVLNYPPTLYTGGSDGSIIWWNLPSSANAKQEVEPIAMLCGHATSIADLGICYPSAVSGDGKLDNVNQPVSTSHSENSGALFSACKDGVLCVWSRASGHCRRRRKMPPWVGSPSVVRVLPDNQRYVCVACWNAESIHVSNHKSFDVEHEGLLNRESGFAKSSKCTVVIVDSYSLAIVQTVFHGNLSIGPLKSISVILSSGHMENHSVMMVDAFSKVHCLPILKDSEITGESATRSSTQLDLKDWLDGSKEGGVLMTCVSRGQLLVLVYSTYCTFRLMDDGQKLGEILFSDHQLCLEGDSALGAIFVDDDDITILTNFGGYENLVSEVLIVWNNRGAAVVYRISYSRYKFTSEPMYSIPAVPRPSEVKLSLTFVFARDHLLRIESICCHGGQPMFWKPYITIWLLPQLHDCKETISGDFKKLSEGLYFDSWINSSAHKSEGSGDDICFKKSGAGDELFSSDNSVSSSNKGEKFVSSSMVISKNCVPFALAYGFCDGDIEVVRFNMYFEGLSFSDQSPSYRSNPQTSKLYLSGHTGAVLCLASHQMVSKSAKGDFSHVLVSGSMDCTVRIWDLDSSNLIIVMHQHVAPVRQIVLPPLHVGYPWSDCFLSVAEDTCVALTSLGSLQIERMFPGHPYYPSKIVWDGVRGYIACLCPNLSGTSESSDVLYIWDVKTGARERVLRGAAAHSMLDHFSMGTKKEFTPGSLMTKNTSASSLIFPVVEEVHNAPSHSKLSAKPENTSQIHTSMTESGKSSAHVTKEIESSMFTFQNDRPPVEGTCPFPGIATLCFDLKSLISACKSNEFLPTASIDHIKAQTEDIQVETPREGAHEQDRQEKDPETEIKSPRQANRESPDFSGTSSGTAAEFDWLHSLGGCLLNFSLSLLHLWNVDIEVDRLLETEMKLKRPDFFNVASGMIGDRGALTLTFPGSSATLEIWKSSSEYCALRSLTVVALAQQLISLTHSCSGASSALAAFYTRNFAEKFPEIKPPLLQVLVSFWQDQYEHVKMAARSLFHCAASRAIPRPLCCKKGNPPENSLCSSEGITEMERGSPISDIKTNSGMPERHPDVCGDSQTEESEILSWLESFDMQDWISCVGGTNQDAMTSHIIVSAALAVWYPSLVKPSLAELTVESLVKLVMAMNEKYSCTAAEILAEGMESTWGAYIGSEIPRMIGDIFFQIECVSSSSAKGNTSAISNNIRDTLVGILLPSLAMADVSGFLHVIQRQIWSTASDSPVHVVALMTITRVVRGSPRNLAQHLDKVVTFILLTMDPSNSVMRRSCLQSSMSALRELVRVFPMVALNDASTRLAVGDAIAEIKNASIRVYDMQSMVKIKVLDASGPPGLPTLLGGASETAVTTAISALSFSQDGEGLVAFSENVLMIRWWSLGSVWWEKLSRNLTPVQCTKLIFVPPWEGFSPTSTRSSIMASAISNDAQVNLQVF
ncbi:OLC1v1029867C2 [Oldenlandia corymbosa var. corymbosa]|uniref:OLC1v1029867C2 n=1 Tax=Oldenlandia corymbosa var. corymbosa TaxID=529605 RepID=A0AAV1CER8_OLDCO|nr:OLC1v1029867C2 [Oldenlandia corymbosa var. corymbosa]